MRLGNFGYYVSAEQRQREIRENEAIVAQLDACAALTAFYRQAHALGWSEFEPELLVFVSPEACEALGVPLDRVADFIDAIGVCDCDLPAWMPTASGHSAAAILADVRTRFGCSVAHPDAWPRLRSTALRRAATARRALRA